jgi:hypothetical protein
VGAVLRAVDETGKRFGSLLVLTRAPAKSGGARWHCKCLCGAATTARGDNLRSGRTTTCGCAGRAKDAPAFDMKTPPQRPSPNRETVRTVTVAQAPPPPPPLPGLGDLRALKDAAFAKASADLKAGREVEGFLALHPDCGMTYSEVADELGL